MNSVQARLQSGQANCTLLENIADKLLVLPRILWNEDTVFFNGDCNDVTIVKSKSFTNIIKTTGLNLGVEGFAGSIVTVLVSGAYVLSSIVATPLLFAGLLTKEVSFIDIKAKSFNKLIASSPKLSELQKKNNFLIKELTISGPTEILINKLFNIYHDGERDNSEKLFKTMRKSNDNFSKILLTLSEHKKIESEIYKLKIERTLLNDL